MEFLTAPSPVIQEPAGPPVEPDVELAGGVVLRFGSSRYALDMSDVAEVVPIPTVTRVPGVPRWVLGVANWRGHVLPVLDLRPVVQSEDLPLASSARLVVVARDGIEVGLVAEAVPGLIDPRPLRPAPGTVSASAAAVVRGVIDDNGPVSVLDGGAVLALRADLAAARSSRRS